MNRDKSRKYGTNEFLDRILEFENVKLVELNPEEEEIRVNLQYPITVSAIGRGEASIIAVCMHRFENEKYLPVIDDKKGRKRLYELMTGIDCAYSLDLFLHPKVMSKLGKKNVLKVLFSAPDNAQMSVSKENLEFVNVFFEKHS